MKCECRLFDPGDNRVTWQYGVAAELDARHRHFAARVHNLHARQLLVRLTGSFERRPLPGEQFVSVRVAQLTNKTNQFNLTTRRYAQHEIEAAAADPNAIGIYGKLTDRFGDNGLISIVLGRKQGTELDIELWLMSCRVLKRDMEQAMLDELVRHAQAIGITALRGTYIPTKKNGMVADHYDKLGFTPVSVTEDGVKTYIFGLHGYTLRNTHIRVLDTTEL